MRFAAKLALTLAAVLAIAYALASLVQFDYAQAARSFGWLGILAVSFVSSSIFFVFSSEAVILAAAKFVPGWQIIVFGTIGSTLGALLNYAIGRAGLHRLLDDDSKGEKRAEKWFARWGDGIVFFASAIPFLGDPLTVMAGILRMDPARFAAYSLAGRALKIAALVAVGQYLAPLARW